MFLIDVARNRLHERFLSPEHSSKLQESLRICAPAYSNCNVCNDTDMAKSSKHCKKHKRTVEVMVESLKSDPEKLKEFTDLRDNAPDEPPSAFASSVTEFELKFPGRGSGKKRGHTTSDVVVTVTKHTASTYVKKGTRLVMMHQEQWMKHAKEKLVLPPNEAKLRWDNAEANTPKEATDQKGPAHSPLRLPMPKEDYVDGACEVGQSKEVNIESKRQKITNEEQVAEKQKGLTDGHASFNNEMFKKVGGSAMAAVAAVGGTAIGSLGQGSFGTIEQNSNIFAEQVKKLRDEKAKEESEKKPAKAIDVELSRNKLLEKLSTEKKKTAGKLTKMDDALRKAKEVAKQRIAGEDAVPGLGRYFDTLKDREVLASLVAIAVPDDGVNVTQAKEIVATYQTQLKPGGGLASCDLATEVVNLLMDVCFTETPEDAAVAEATKKLDEIVSRYVGSGSLDPLTNNLLHIHGLTASASLDTPSLRTLMDDFLHLLTWTMGCCKLVDELDKRAVDGKALPLPEPDINKASVMGSYAVYPWRILAAPDSDTLKELDKQILNVGDMIGKISSFVAGSADEVVKAAERHDKKTKSAAEQQSKKEKASAEKAQKDKEKAAKAQAERVGASGSFSILDAEHACIKRMPSYANKESLMEASKKGFSGSFTFGAPFILTSNAQLRAVCEERVLKSTIGVFRVQFPASVQCKKEGRGFTPLHNDKKDALMEIMQSLAPQRTPVPRDLIGTIIDKSVNQMLFYGGNVGNKAAFFQRQGLPSCVYQLSGTKEVVITDFASLSDYAQEAGIVKDPDEDFFDWCVDLFKGISVQEQFDAFANSGGTFWKGTIHPDQFMYVPLGSFVMERVLGSTMVVGFRASVLDPTRANLGPFKEMAANVHSCMPDSHMDKFWTGLIKVLESAPCDTGGVLTKTKVDQVPQQKQDPSKVDQVPQEKQDQISKLLVNADENEDLSGEQPGVPDGTDKSKVPPVDGSPALTEPTVASLSLEQVPTPTCDSGSAASGSAASAAPAPTPAAKPGAASKMLAKAAAMPGQQKLAKAPAAKPAAAPTPKRQKGQGA